jgi:hypothetical protein
MTIDMAALAKNGLWPMTGGSMNQTKWATQAFPFAWSELDAAVRATDGKK